MTIVRVVRNRGALSTGFDADWASRAGGSGVFFDHNFTYRNAAKTQLISTAAHLIESSWDNAVQADDTLIEYDTVNKLSGNGSCRINLRAADFGGNVGFRVGWDGIGVGTKNTAKSQFYFQWSYYLDSYWHDWYFNTSNYGGKIAIFQAPDKSFNTGEVVLRRDFRPGGWLSSYRVQVGGASNLLRLFYSNLSQRANYAFLDRDTPSPVASTNDLQQRHGPHSQTADPTGDDPDFQWAPHLVRGGWTTIEAYIDLINKIVKFWIAPYGEAPTLIIGGMDVPGHTYVGLPDPGISDGTAFGDLYSGVQLTSYMNDDDWGGGGDWVEEDTFCCYAELIGSDDEIPFPGGHALPFPGTDVPTGWPPTDTTPNAEPV